MAASLSQRASAGCSCRIVGHSETVRLGACRPFVELPACLKLPRNGDMGSEGPKSAAQRSATISYIHMVFVWDEKKNRINRRKHGISFETAARIFEDPNVVSYRDRVVGEEERWHAIGSAGSIAIVLVVHTSEEQHGEEEIRIIPARKASPRERALYHPH